MTLNIITKIKKKRNHKKNIQEFPHNLCNRTFGTYHGQRVHIGRKHKEEMKESGLINCEMFDWKKDSKKSEKVIFRKKNIKNS